MWTPLYILPIFLPCVAVADELHLILNGRSYHFDDKDWNENNYGLGFEYDFKRNNNWIPLITGSSFKDSSNETSKYLGGGVKRRFFMGQNKAGWHLDAGLIGFVMTRKNYKNDDHFVAAAPFISLGNEVVALNATYIPKLTVTTPATPSLLYVQLMLKLAEY